MAKFEFVGFCARGEAEDLVAEADAENRFFQFHGFANDVVERREDGGVAGAVGDEDAVEFDSGFDEIVAPWDADDREIAGEEISDDVVFHAAVDADDGLFSAFVGLWFFYGDLVHEGFVEVGIVEIWCLGIFNQDFAEHGACLTEGYSEGTGVDAGDGWNFVFLEPF